MACCGRSNPPPPPPRSPGASLPGVGLGLPMASVLFRYLGQGLLTLRGPATGATYAFGAHGSVLPVDVRDARYLTAIPGLRRLR